MVYIHNVILLSHKKNELMAFAVTEMDPETIILSEVSKTKSNHINIVYMWNLKKKKRIQMNFQKETCTLLKTNL